MAGGPAGVDGDVWAVEPAAAARDSPHRPLDPRRPGGAHTSVLGFLVGAVMGLVFAVLGAGGGILSVPVLLILFALPLADATGAGLVVVFAAALTAALGHARVGRVDWRTALVLGPSTMLGAAAGARLSPLVPERVTAGAFALVLLVATAALFLPRPRAGRGAPLTAPLLLLLGAGLGVLTGFLGVGGGFLMVPVLVALAGLPLARAVGTSTVLIALGSLAGGATTLLTRPALAGLVLPLAGGAVLGAVLGVPLSGRLPDRVLRLGFAGLSVVVAAGMTAKAAGLTP